MLLIWQLQFSEILFFGRCIISVIQTIKYNYFVCIFCPSALSFQYYTCIHCGTNSPLIYSVEFGNRMPHFFFIARLNITLEQFWKGKGWVGKSRARVKSIAVKKLLSLNYFLFWDWDWYFQIFQYFFNELNTMLDFNRDANKTLYFI